MLSVLNFCFILCYLVEWWFLSYDYFSLAWELVTSVNFEASTQTYSNRNLEILSAVFDFLSPPGASDTQTEIREPLD